MARGQQKIQSQQKNAERQAKMKKAKSGDNKKSAQAALVIICPVCTRHSGFHWQHYLQKL